ncbi:MAG: ABC transporter substrate-binding protein, partial [Cyanobacteria bacterium P01_F01_bin.53]
MTTYNIHYWQPYLERLGLTRNDIPQDWQGFWQFWQDVRDQLHQLGEEEIANLCISLNKESSEARAIFMQFLHSHNVRIFDEQGEFVLNAPDNRQGLIDTLSQLSRLYRDGYIPPGAMTWSNADNNIQFLDRQCLLVINGSLSIPLTQQQPDSPYTQKVRNRYFDEIVTLPSWPRTVKGTPVEILVGLPRFIIPVNAKQQAIAKEFLTYLLQPENLQRFVEERKGRMLPPMPELLNTPFWQNYSDPHLAAVQSLSKGKTSPYPDPRHPAYVEISQEMIFGTALESVIRNDVSPAVAADDAIARIEEIIAQYDP